MNDDQYLKEENVERKKKLTFVHRGVCGNVKEC